MQISRHLLMTCAVSAILIPAMAHAYDNEAQIRARQALEEKMKQIDTQVPPATSTPPAAVKPKPAAKPQPPVITVTPSAVTVEKPPMQTPPAFAPEVSRPITVAPAMAAPSMSTPSTDSATSEKLNQALHQKMRETDMEPMVKPTAPSKPQMVEKPVVPAVVPPMHHENHMETMSHPALTSTPSYAPIPAPSNTVRPTLPSTPTPQAEPAPMANQNQSAPPVVSLPPLGGPSSSLSASKQQKLDALLQQYRLDQLTPQQYHEERAKVLSEP